MATANQARKVALALPDVAEKSHFGKPDFRVKGKIFAGLSSDGTRCNLKLEIATQELAIATRPETFQPAEGAWGRAGWTHVVLAGTSVAELRLLLAEAHRLVARRA